jgi:hypothetical protein
MCWTGRRSAGLCLAVVASGALVRASQDQPAPAATPPSPERGALAIMRRDGLMLPFAAFNRNSWQIAWPLVPTGEIPVTIEAIPERWWGTPTPTQWRLRLTSGEERPLELSAPQIYRTFCSMRIGVRTNYRSAHPLPPSPVEPFPKDGVAISGSVPIEPIEMVDSASAEWRALTASLVTEFNKVEEQTATRVRHNTGWRHPTAPAARRTLPIRLESWYRSPMEPGWTVSYIEAVRQYPPGPEDKGCGLETLVSGWLHHYNGELKDASDLVGKITYCDRVGATYMLPFGRMRIRERNYWIFQLSGWEDEWYEVAEVRPEKIRYVIEVYAGGRRSCR